MENDDYDHTPLALVDETPWSVISLFWALNAFESVDVVSFTDIFYHKDCSHIKSFLHNDLELGVFPILRPEPRPEKITSRAVQEINYVVNMFKDRSHFVFPYSTDQGYVYDLENTIQFTSSKLEAERRGLRILTPLSMLTPDERNYLCSSLVGCESLIKRFYR